MSVDGHRTSVFTFQSSVHSSYVLRSLDEQRQNDVLCDVTILVENRSYRAHSSVLATCSDFFHSRFLGHASQSRVITLPDNVTVEGFEPLLEFAYTAKLLFTKDNILEIHRCAEFLGFHNLDQSCFEFLIPKFHKDGSGTTEAQKAKKKSSGDTGHQRNTTTTAGQAQGPGEIPTDISQHTTQDRAGVAGQCLDPTLAGQPSQPSTSVLPEGSLSLDFSPPKSPTFPAANGQDQFCLQTCGPELQPSSSTAPEQVCPFLKMVESSGYVGDSIGDESMLDLTSSGCEGDVSMETCPILEQQSPSPFPDQIGVPEACGQASDQAVVTVQTSAQSSRLCQLNSPEPLEPGNIMKSTNQLESGISFHAAGHTTFSNTSPEASGNRSSVEREVAEHLAKGFWPDLAASLSEPLPLDEVVEQSASENASAAADFHWLKHLDLGSDSGECPFLRNLGSEEAQTPVGDCSSLPQQDKSPCMSSTNSDDDFLSDTEGEREVHRERAEEIQLPFPVEQIPAMTRSAFQQMLRKQSLTQEQLEFIHDVRRRSKNRVAAQRSRKRKLDCIRKLECEIKKLRGQKEKLLQERTHLKLSMGQTLQGLSGLCQAVCGDGGPQPDQLQLLAQHLPPHATSSSSASSAPGGEHCSPCSFLLTPMASPGLAGQERDGPSADGSAVCATKEPSGVEAATPCPQAEPAMPEEKDASREERTGAGRLGGNTSTP